MLELIIDETETYDERQKKLIRVPASTLRLEHSLRSLSKWESFWEVPFFSNTKKTTEQLLSYVSMMADSPIDEKVLASFNHTHFEQINAYLSAKHSATWFSDDDSKKSSGGTIVTSELIYYWMTTFNIPFDPCEDWPIQRLMTLIKIAQIKTEQQNSKSKRPRSQMLSERAALNAKRRAEMNSKG